MSFADSDIVCHRLARLGNHNLFALCRPLHQAGKLWSSPHRDSPGVRWVSRRGIGFAAIVAPRCPNVIRNLDPHWSSWSTDFHCASPRSIGQVGQPHRLSPASRSENDPWQSAPDWVISIAVFPFGLTLAATRNPISGAFGMNDSTTCGRNSRRHPWFLLHPPGSRTGRRHHPLLVHPQEGRIFVLAVADQHGSLRHPHPALHSGLRRVEGCPRAAGRLAAAAAAIRPRPEAAHA